MRFALLQKTLDPPNPDALRRAFRRLDFLTDGDAAALTRDAYGILVDRLPLDQAEQTRQALRAEGVETVLVQHDELFKLPPGPTVRRLDLTPEHLIHHDALDRPHELAWSHVTLIAAALVSERRSKPGEIAWVGGFRAGGPSGAGAVQSLRTDEVTKLAPRLELFTEAEPPRLRIDAERFNYQCLGDRMASASHENFLLLVRELAAHAPHALLNRGARSICDPTPHVLSYPNAHAFEEELVWSFWRASHEEDAG